MASEKRAKLSFSQKVQEAVLLWVKDNYVRLYHDLEMKNPKEEKTAAWKELTNYANELLEGEKKGSAKVKDSGTYAAYFTFVIFLSFMNCPSYTANELEFFYNDYLEH